MTSGALVGAIPNDDREAGKLATQLRQYVGKRLGTAVEVAAVARLAGGASHDTWAFDVVGENAEGSSLNHFVLRRDFEEGLLDTSLDNEFALLNALHRLGIPVPQPFWQENCKSHFGAPCMITERVRGTDLRKALAGARAGMQRKELGTALANIQAQIHAVDCKRHLQNVKLADTASYPLSELDRWASIFEPDDRPVKPLVRAAIGWLRANVPATAEYCLIHGDFKANNILFGEQNTMTVLDWELSHLGDPLEDLAWTMLWTTEWDLVEGLLPARDYLAAYSRASGRTVDESRLNFWQLFSLVKLAAIFQKSASAGIQMASRPTLAMLGRALPFIDNAIAAHLLQEHERRGAQ